MDKITREALKKLRHQIPADKIRRNCLHPLKKKYRRKKKHNKNYEQQ